MDLNHDVPIPCFGRSKLQIGEFTIHLKYSN